MTPQAPQWLRLPVELRQRPQWLLAGPNDVGELKVPVTVGMDGRVRPGSSTDRTTWLDFEYAMECALEYGYGLGYVLAADDPFTCVDFDVKNPHNAPDHPEKWTSEDDLQRMHMLVEDLDSYTELSQSNQGVHVWCLGKIGDGIKRRGVELYSMARFIACTGRVVHDKPIADRQEELSQLAANMRDSAQATHAATLHEADSDLSDEEVMRRATIAENAEKFGRLWRGEWQAMGYPSQSEADLSLMSMLTFYSRSNDQCRRLFRRSKLGDREKALKNDRYLDYTLRLIRGRQAKEAAADAVGAENARRVVEKALDDKRIAQALAYAAQLQAQAGPSAAPAGPTGPPVPPPTPGALDWPPGLVGAVARFIYASAPRPVKEVAIVAALGWIAGVCGKGWVIPGSGLNLYIILVARSGIGKEAMHSGLGALVGRLREGVPSAGHYVDFSDFASGPALAKACAAQSSFVNVAGEFGHKLKRMAAEGGNDSTMRQLRTVMTNLYQKSGPASIVGGITYSNKDSNIASITGVAFSMIGETTPETLYASLTESMMEDGFLSRFTIIEYDGLRPPANPSPVLQPDGELTHACQSICVQATTLLQNHKREAVQRTAEAAALMDAFDAECDGQINGSTDEGWRQMWNRAHLKMMRIAALLAVGDNHMQPVIQAHHVVWALDVIRRDIGIMRKRMDGGDVGQGDSSRDKKLLTIVKEFITETQPLSYGIPAQMQKDGVVPRKYLMTRAYRVASFSGHKFGAKRALDDAIQSCCDNGYIVEMDKVKVGEAYTYQGRCFRVVQLPN
jgi:hypothetical protein